MQSNAQRVSKDRQAFLRHTTAASTTVHFCDFLRTFSLRIAIALVDAFPRHPVEVLFVVSLSRSVDMAHICHTSRVDDIGFLARRPSLKKEGIARGVFKKRKTLTTSVGVAAVLMIVSLFHLPAAGFEPAPPTIVSFTASSDGSTWTFSGQVLDESPSGLTVTFGGLLNGHETTTSEGGYFEYTANVNGSGVVTASTVDDDGVPSNIVMHFIL
jgi:hypothetical protein